MSVNDDTEEVAEDLEVDAESAEDIKGGLKWAHKTMENHHVEPNFRF